MYVDSLKRPDGFSDDDLLILLDIAQRVSLAVETDQVAFGQRKAAEGSVRDGEERIVTESPIAEEIRPGYME
jgi:hypothetical protein